MPAQHESTVALESAPREQEPREVEGEREWALRPSRPETRRVGGREHEHAGCNSAGRGRGEPASSQDEIEQHHHHRGEEKCPCEQQPRMPGEDGVGPGEVDVLQRPCHRAVQEDAVARVEVAGEAQAGGAVIAAAVGCERPVVEGEAAPDDVQRVHGRGHS